MSPTDPTGDALAPPAPADDAALLTVSGLTKSFGANRVLDGVDLEVRRGEVVVLIGPSGSGKTTVLRSLNGLETPESGVVAFSDGPRVDFSAPLSKSDRIALRDRSAMVFQHHNLFPHRTVLQNVTEGPIHAHGVPKDEAVERAEALLERVGLSEKRDAYPFELSGGQQQRVGIVRALALQPSLLLFDEPTSALDSELVGEVLLVLKELADEGWTMLIVTHELAFARQVADEVLFFDQGVIVERGAPKELFTNPRNDRTRRFVDRLLRPFEG
ncbi:amino acid ABC transporter ATP-binding protein [Microbacterium sp. SSM24]|uniref:amino acid ABC transporter ATP-binding protein n=1 Tax=Microbacterium sp. SSM24 TaxID=2991714 RepID=UPI0029D4186F|nr:amino acid ABC transporter ATP-binding protein [Microbacterium sp. SSM24]